MINSKKTSRLMRFDALPGRRRERKREGLGAKVFLEQGFSARFCGEWAELTHLNGWL